MCLTLIIHQVHLSTARKNIYNNEEEWRTINRRDRKGPPNITVYYLKWMVGNALTKEKWKSMLLCKLINCTRSRVWKRNINMRFTQQQQFWSRDFYAIDNISQFTAQPSHSCFKLVGLKWHNDQQRRLNNKKNL